MSYDSSEVLNTDLRNAEESVNFQQDQAASTTMSREEQKEAETHCQLRNRIEALLEKKRLKELLDDSDDW